MAKPILDTARLRELLHYDAETGAFLWRVRRGRGVIGASAGYLRSDGYLVICIDKTVHSAHRLAWLHAYGVWPVVIDHIDGDRANNRLSNLRNVTQTVNKQNIVRPGQRSSTGILGVTPRNKKWQAQISVDGKRLYLGNFATAEEAQAAYLSAKRKYHPGCTI